MLLFCTRLWAGGSDCFLLYDLTDDVMVIQDNPELCSQRLNPCSTFKIAHALIALELDVLGDDRALPWDGTAYSYKVWEQDHTLASAIRYSVVWYFQEVARRVGPDSYSLFLSQLEYGNGDSSSDLETFWLGGGSLLISPYEQVVFLNRLYRNQLPVSTQSMETLKPMLVRQLGGKWTLSGKTGSSDGIGWFVGHLDSFDHEYTFVACLLEEGASGAAAERITERWLTALGLLHD